MAAHILIVDDDGDIRDALSEALRDEGYDVHVASGGDAALADMRRERPALVLLDLMMPPLDGWDVVAAMRRDPPLADVPVCVFSAAADLEAPVEATCILAKPASLEALLAVVGRYCARSPLR